MIVSNDIGECNAKQIKDLIIIIDFNIYNNYNQDDKNNENFNVKNNIEKINIFIDQTKTILDNYLSSNDRLAVFIYKTQYQIICPLMAKNEIDSNNFSKDLSYYHKNTINEINEDESSSNEIIENNLILSGTDSQKSFQSNSKQIKIDDNNIIKGLIKTINFCQNYLKLKEDTKNEKFILLFTDIFNTYKINDTIITSNFRRLGSDKEITFLLIGKNKEKNVINNKNKNLGLNEEININEKILKNFSEKSEVIYYENMKKIKNIISNNSIIKDVIIYPNEIYI